MDQDFPFAVSKEVFNLDSVAPAQHVRRQDGWPCTPALPVALGATGPIGAACSQLSLLLGPTISPLLSGRRDPKLCVSLHKLLDNSKSKRLTLLIISSNTILLPVEMDCFYQLKLSTHFMVSHSGTPRGDERSPIPPQDGGTSMAVATWHLSTWPSPSDHPAVAHPKLLETQGLAVMGLCQGMHFRGKLQTSLLIR